MDIVEREIIDKHTEYLFGNRYDELGNLYVDVYRYEFEGILEELKYWVEGNEILKSEVGAILKFLLYRSFRIEDMSTKDCEKLAMDLVMKWV